MRPAWRRLPTADDGARRSRRPRASRRRGSQARGHTVRSRDRWYAPPAPARQGPAVRCDIRPRSGSFPVPGPWPPAVPGPGCCDARTTTGQALAGSKTASGGHHHAHHHPHPSPAAARRHRSSVLTLTALAAPAATLAKHGNSTAVIRTGSCSGASDWKLKVKPDDGPSRSSSRSTRTRTARSGTSALKQDGTTFWSGARTTHAPSGSFSVSRLTSNRSGVHQFTGRAVNRTTGEVCRGTASI